MISIGTGGVCAAGGSRESFAGISAITGATAANAYGSRQASTKAMKPPLDAPVR